MKPAPLLRPPAGGHPRRWYNWRTVLAVFAMAIDKATDRPRLPYAERQARRAMLARADRSNKIEGLEPSATGRAIGDMWVDGTVTIDEAVAMLKRHYAGKADA